MGSTRREFVKLAAAVAAGSTIHRLGAETKQANDAAAGRGSNLEFRSTMLRVEMAVDQPGFVAFAVDSLGTKKLDGNMMLPLAKPSRTYKVSRNNQTIAYALAEAEDSPVWTFEFSERGFVIRSTPLPNLSLQPGVLRWKATRPYLVSSAQLGQFTSQLYCTFPIMEPFASQLRLRV
jgi:hypothetical protein